MGNGMNAALPQHPSRTALSRAPAAVGEGATASALAPVPLDTATAATADERRQETRREFSSNRTFAPLTGSGSASSSTIGSWHLVSGTIGLSLAGALALTMQVPGVLPSVLMLGALVVNLLVPQAIRRIITEQVALRLALEMALLVTPLLLLGIGLSLWMANDNLPWGVDLAVRTTVGAVTATCLRRRPAIIMASQWALWVSQITSDPTTATFVAFACSGVVVLLVGQREQSAEHDEELHRAARDRAQSRARDILLDYEDTRQGWFWETDRRSQLTYISEPVAKALDKDVSGLIGKPLIQLFDLTDATDTSERTLMFHLSTRSSFKELPMRAAITGDDRWWSISGRPIFDGFNNFVGFRGSGTDLTERRRSQEEVSRLANFDSLTGLANRRQINRVLEKILSAQQAEKRCCAVLLLDLDRFMHVNDTMGHPAGDALLKQVAQRLERTVGNMGQVGRLGGDEFKVVVPGKHNRQTLGDLAGAVIHSLSQPYAIEGQRVVIGASIGIAIAPDNGEDGDDLVRNADLALYAAKDGGRGRYHFYAQDLHAEAEARAAMEEDLRDAITKGDLQLYYQPVVSTATEQITGFEALLRWHHPVKGWIPPSRFIQIAEDTGMIAQMGEWALRTACADLADMPSSIRVAVNVSPLQFSNPQLPAIVTHAIAQAGVSPEQLELEITESVFLSDDAGTEAMFKALKRVGVRLALDDFGTGYSSLGYLRTAPFDKIKIDQSFVRGATQEGSRNGAIIASITSLAHALGMETTAEGVETLDELDLVRLHGCSHVQGYIYDRPLDAETAKARLATGLMAVAHGPRAARAPRQTMLRKVVLDHAGTQYDGTIRNISSSGAMIEGLWNVPVGTVFKVHISQGFVVSCTTRWSQEDRIGVEFANALQRDDAGRILAVQGAPVKPVRAVAAH